MIKKVTKILLVIVISITMFGCKKVEPITTADFDKQMLDWFVEDISSDYLSLHFALVNPEKYGIENVEVSLGEVDVEDDGTYKERLNILKNMNTNNLSPDQLLTYETVLEYFQLQQDSYDFEEDYSFIFTPNSGVNNNLTTNFTEFDIRSEQDAKDLITLVKDSKRYIDECITYTRDLYTKGIVQSASCIASITDQCARFIEHVEDNEVIKAYSASIKKLGLADEANYIAELTTAVKEYLIPAYQSIIDMYDELESQASSKSLSEYEKGKEFYEILFKIKSSSSVTVEEYEKLLLSAIKDKYKELIATYSKSPTAYEKWANGDYDYGYKDVYDIFTLFKSKMTTDFPAIPEVDYTIAYLDPSVTSDNISAYYLIAPYDDPSTNVVKVNPSFADKDANGLCITLAHEGYPGHLYQHTYYFTNHPNSEIRYNIDFIGMTEGWAMYVEDYAYGYFPMNSNITKLSRLDNMMGYYLYAYIDILANYEGYSVRQIGDVLDELGYNSSIAQSIYDTVTGDPAMFVPYALGLYQMMALRNTAQNALGSKYSSLEYNKLLLDTGITSFDIMKKVVDKYIEEKNN